MAYNYINSMFSGSSLFSNSSSSNSSSFGSSNFLSDYASIRNGSYGKLMKAYYSKDSSGTSKTNTSKSTKKSDSALDPALTEIKSDADSLKSAASKLTTQGDKSLFTQKYTTTTDATTGEKTTTKGYDTDAIVKAVKAFADEYNDLLDSTSESDDGAILQKSIQMIKNTSAYSKNLEGIGITIGANNKLTVDTEKLKSADMSTVKSLFNGTNSFAYQTSQRASQVGQQAIKSATAATNYTSSAQYQYNNYSSSYSAYF